MNNNPVIRRMRRKIEVMRLDRKARGDVVYHDLDELLALIEILEREETQE